MGRNACVTTLMSTKARPAPYNIDLPVADIRTEESLDSKNFAELRRRVILDGCKWDAQVGDKSTLAPFPLVIKRPVWNRLATWAESLTTEAIAAEQEISQRPELLRLLGLPRALLLAMAGSEPLTPAAGRIIRFDFHFTKEGWRISEANSDVPGGFSEASHFTNMIAAFYPHLITAGNPAEKWCDVLAESIGPAGQVALLSAPPYLEDHQVIAYLAINLRRRGCHAHLAKPEQIRWRDGIAHLDTSWHRGPMDAIYRFYQAEWLTRLPKGTEWQYFFRGGRTPVANPPLSPISESKRFPLTWKHISPRMPTWRALLPAVCDPREIFWFNDGDWLLKTAFCNNGDTVCVRELMKHRHWWQAKLLSRWSPKKWVAQRRFESAPISTPLGPRHVCVGVYTINGKTVGAYTRLSEGPVVDFSATDVALLIDANE
jgi:hypothetical protein